MSRHKMAKHHPIKMKLWELAEAIDNNWDEWFHVMNVEIPGMKDAIKSEDHYKQAKLEADYLNAHQDDIYLVSWPDHVINPRFNSDASYQLIMSDKHNRMAWQWAKHNQGFTGTYDEWKLLDDEERQQYEDGAAGIGTV